jgi:hypothetical protein
MQTQSIFTLEVFVVYALLAFSIYQVAARPLVLLAFDHLLSAIRDRLLEDSPPAGLREDAAWKSLGGSSAVVVSASVRPKDGDATEPVFTTLRAETKTVADKEWFLKVRFVIVNPSSLEIVVNDMHVHSYLKDMPVLPKASWIYRSEVMITQDNTLWKDNQSYSVKPGDALEMVVVLGVTRYEDDNVPGPLRSVFGIFVDYSVISVGGRVVPKAIPSDCVYLFEYQDLRHPGSRTWRPLCDIADRECVLKAINQSEIQALEQQHVADKDLLRVVDKMRQVLEKHTSSRPVPKM